MSTILASRLDDLDESPTMALDSQAKRMIQEGETVYNLTAGELSTDTPEYIQSAVTEVLHQNQYTAPAGLPELREIIASSARERYGLDWIKAANVIVTAGAKPALYLSMLAVIDHGDEVIVPVPAWATFGQLAGLAGGKAVEVLLTEDFDLDVEAIQTALTPRTRAIILNSPQNPTGATFSKAALTRLAGILKDTDVTVIADDIYSKLVYSKDFTLVPTCGFEKLVIINGFSKSQILTGWRIGYCIAQDDVSSAINKLIGHTMGNASLMSQHAALAAMKQGDVPPGEVTDMLKKHLRLVRNALEDTPITFRSPGGAFYAFLDLRAVTKNSAEWCKQLLEEKGVALVPGEAFSAPGFARLTYSADEPTLKAALAAIKEFIAQKDAA